MLGNQWAKGHKPNITSFKTGQPAWNKGKTFSGDSKMKMRLAKLGKKGYWSGKQRPEMSGSNNPHWGKFGQEHPKWKDIKLRPFYKSIRQLFKYVDWRKSVFKRDNFTCITCNATKCYIEADHFPKRFIDIVRNNNIQSVEDALNCPELWDITNGRTLCKPCHLKTDTWGRKRL